MSTPKQEIKDASIPASNASEQSATTAVTNGNEDSFRSYQSNPYQQQPQSQQQVQPPQPQVSQGYYYTQAAATSSQATQQQPAPSQLSNAYPGYQPYQYQSYQTGAAPTQYADYKYNYQQQQPPPPQAVAAQYSGTTQAYQPLANTYQTGVQPSAIGQIQPVGSRPRVTTTMWEDEKTLCYQVDANSVSVVRRADNNMINGTKLLNVAHMTRGRRDGILKSEKVRDVVKIGSMHLKGVWIPFERALAMAQKEGIVDLLYPLFVRDIKQVIQQGSTTQPNQAPPYNYMQQSAQPGPAAPAAPQATTSTAGYSYGAPYGNQTYYGNGNYQQQQAQAANQASPQQPQVQTAQPATSSVAPTSTAAPSSTPSTTPATQPNPAAASALQYQSTGYPGYQQYPYASYQVPQQGQYYQGVSAGNPQAAGQPATTASSSSSASSAVNSTGANGSTASLATAATNTSTSDTANNAAQGTQNPSSSSNLPANVGYTQYQYGYPTSYSPYPTAAAQASIPATAQASEEK